MLYRSMKIFLVLLLLIGLGSYSKASIGTHRADSIANVLLGDPFILVDKGTYYMYGTGSKSENHRGIEVYRSKDLVHWEGPCGAREGLALDHADVWGTKGFWAPEVFKVGEKYYMFYTANEHSLVAVSSSPLGPFKQEVKEPLIETKAIDGSLFIDTDGKKYYYFVNFTPDGMQSWVAEINDNLLSIKKETMRKCVGQSQPWEHYQSVNEGPCVQKHGNTYYLVYSGNAFDNQNYGLGYATSSSPMGPWTKWDKNPFWQKPGDLVGVGHCQFFIGLDKKEYMVYHAHNSKTSIHPRKAYINPVRFSRLKNSDQYRLEVLPKMITPVLN